MTRLETQVLDLLREDCRLPLEKLAVMLGVSTEEVAETIDSLERRRVILHYAPTINWDLTDRERVEAMIQVSVTPQRDMGFDAVARRIYRFELYNFFFISFSVSLVFISLSILYIVAPYKEINLGIFY